MKFWNDIDGSIFFNQVFKTSVAIGFVEFFTVNIENNRPTIILEFDIEELPDAPPEKWKKTELNTCRIGLNCSEISSLTIKNIPTKEKLSIRITQSDNLFTIHASNNNSTIEFTTKSLLLCGPSVYMNDKKNEFT
ncbi:hypothetical protein HCU66_07125 [Pseudomonas frederiksbergensis]|uniref:Imm50 family immunity protein n=1 Tax=Pseudomonas frederiksbergensis TaxID=104087 RepID=UPI0019804717|nr:Imm50 family immunity protein [Pseudomonas frederiksbergensis]MBN3861999.1 hypothetical protein [Pseudomonas frederiksbergensis]